MAIVGQFLRSFKNNFLVSIKFMIGEGIGNSLPSKSWELEKLVSEANTVFDMATRSFKSPPTYLPFVDDDIDSVNAVGVEFDDMVKQLDCS